MTSQEDYLTGRQHHRNMTSQEDNLTGIGPHRKTNSQEGDQTGRRPQRKKTLKEVDVTGRWPHRMMNLQKKDLTGKWHHRHTTSQEADFTIFIASEFGSELGTAQPQLVTSKVSSAQVDHLPNILIREIFPIFLWFFTLLKLFFFAYLTRKRESYLFWADNRI